jgi:hypothetical protein
MSRCLSACAFHSFVAIFELIAGVSRNWRHPRRASSGRVFAAGSESLHFRHVTVSSPSGVPAAFSGAGAFSMYELCEHQSAFRIGARTRQDEGWPLGIHRTTTSRTRFLHATASPSTRPSCAVASTELRRLNGVEHEGVVFTDGVDVVLPRRCSHLVAGSARRINGCFIDWRANHANSSPCWYGQHQGFPRLNVGLAALHAASAFAQLRQ